MHILRHALIASYGCDPNDFQWADNVLAIIIAIIANLNHYIVIFNIWQKSEFSPIEWHRAQDVWWGRLAVPVHSERYTIINFAIQFYCYAIQ